MSDNPDRKLDWDEIRYYRAGVLEDFDKLKAEIARLRNWQRRAVEELREARDDVVECSNRTWKPHTVAYYKDRLKAIDALLEKQP